MSGPNPFEFGRELSAAELVDRQEELEAVLQTIRERGRLFLIGPRRYGKTSILRAAAERAEREGMVVLRHDSEAYPSIHLLAEALISDAARRLTGSIDRAGKSLREFFAALRPSISFNPVTNTFAATITTDAPMDEPALLSSVLNGLDRMASQHDGPVAVVIDEFQHVIEHEGSAAGLATERQLRAAVQRHDNVGYVFAGSKTAMLAEMTGDVARPFYRLGRRLFVGPIPREHFIPFLQEGFEVAGLHATEEAVLKVLDLAEDVPYNVQRLAYECWNYLGSRAGEELGANEVRVVLDRLVRRDEPFYTQMWNRLTSTQQKALLAIVRNGGIGLFGREVLERYDLPLSTMRTALDALIKTGIARQEESLGRSRYRLEDPFFAAWLDLFVPQARGP